MSRCSPYPHRLCPPSPWKHPPWTRIAAPRLPMSPIEAPGGWARVRCVWSLCLGRRNGAHWKIERRAEHRSWMAPIWQGDVTTNRIVRIYLGETARRAMAIGEDAIKSFWPSDLGQRNKKSEIRRGFRRPPIDNCTQQPTKFTRDRWGRDRRGRATIGERRGGGILSLRGRSRWEGGGNKMK